ncbi:CUGBP Elav-like family member 1 isoform X5 [Planococcus citri]|uniref:CUGBP Elav-like family member 1 isoform X5 n=1 Tax=Planococcus citri TaxID=170843 RepID=UPI0031F897B4
MLQTLNNLAGKISPHPVPSNGNVIDGNGNKLGHKNNNNNNHATLNNNFGKSEKSFIHAPYKRITSSEQGSPIDELSHKELDMQDQPDPDYIKMFVGQIPRTMDEEELKAMFSEYGRVHQINVLRDKHTGQSKGCCFLTYYTRKAALDAQNALHNIKILPGMHHPIQMKPADSENRNERKLFVGMLSKKCNETDIRNMFEHFGTIEECTVLRDNQGISKGCAFVTYTSKQCAINAIKTMHQSHTMEGCSSPLVVKFADTQKDKDQKKLQQMQSSIWNMAGISFSPQQYLATAALSQQFAPNANETTQCLTPLQLLQQQLQASAAVTNGHSNMNNSLNGLLLHNSQSSDLHGLSNLNGSCHNISDINPVNLQNLATLANLSVTNPAAVNPIHMQNLISLAALTGGNSMSPSGSTANLTNSALSGLANTAAAALLGKKASGLLTSNATPLSALTSNTATLNGFTSNTLSLSELSGSVLGSTNISRDIAINAAGKQIEGPVGANLFIYHLPQDCTDLDLASMFTPFGTLISAKVYIDKDTKRSKCFDLNQAPIDWRTLGYNVLVRI